MPIDIDFNPSQGHVAQDNAYLSYLPSPPLSHWVQSFWQLNVPSGHYGYRSMPDNCVDLIINADDPQDIFIVSSFRRFRLLPYLILWARFLILVSAFEY